MILNPDLEQKPLLNYPCGVDGANVDINLHD